MKVRLTTEQYIDGIKQGNRVILAQAITLVESNRIEDQQQASLLLNKLLPETGKSIRIGITGVPGVGKSSFIETFGMHLTNEGKKIAILTIDPSSQLTKGSILGDKTRMEDLSKNLNAFIRPSATGKTLGGVATKTREAVLLCEAAGYNVIIIETVGVGQSEVAVKNMVDFFLLLMLAGGGDELQGIKKGIMEMADGIVITKADHDNVIKAKEAQAEYQHALQLFSTPSSGIKPNVLICSALLKTGIEEIWQMVTDYYYKTLQSGFLQANREEQNIMWFYDHFEQLIKNDFQQHKLQDKLNVLETHICNNELSPTAAAQQLLHDYHEAIKGKRS